MKRILIYMIYDKNGIVDDYIFFQIRSLKEYVEYICCVVNGFINNESLNRLKKYADKIIVRENVGVDIGAYKCAISKLSWDCIRKYDELILMNYTCFGPLFSLDNLFNWSEREKCDLWGLTLDQKFRSTKGTNHHNKKKFHIQSNFVVYRSTLYKNNFLSTFFAEIPENCGYWESGDLYEYALPGYFEEHGFKASIYCNDIDDCNYPLLHNPLGLIEKYKMPFIKKRSFFHNYSDVLFNGGGEASKLLMDFLKNNDSYNPKFIYSSILRNNNLADIVRNMHLNRVIPCEFSINAKVDVKGVGIIYMIYYNDNVDSVLKYLKQTPKEIDILILLGQSSNLEHIKNIYSVLPNKIIYKKIKNRGRDVSALLVESYDFVIKHNIICFMHDKKSPQSGIYSVGRSWNYKLNENCLCNRKYILNIINMFREEPCLGIAFPSYPNHGPFAYRFDSWSNNYENTLKLLNSLGINIPLNKNEIAIAPFGTCFWFRKEALVNLFVFKSKKRWKYSDFPNEPIKNDGTLLHAIERSYAYICQYNGFYPVFLYNTSYLPIELTNLEFEKNTNELIRNYDRRKFSSDSSKIIYERNKYGIKQSVIFLYDAVCAKLPFVKTILYPLRWVKRKLRR